MGYRNRKYALPYNGSNPDWFVEETDRRKNYIDHVFCEFPSHDVFSHLRFAFEGGNAQSYKTLEGVLSRRSYIDCCSRFLKLSLGRFRRVCTVNLAYNVFRDKDDLRDFCLGIVRVSEEYGIDGLIVSDFRVAKQLRLLNPVLELHTSCNTFSWNVRQMEIWREKCGIKVFNPPRDILRKVSVLKEMHDAGFRLKCIVNEGCLMGCPNTVIHPVSVALGCYNGCSCVQNGIGDIFRGNWILPRWQKHYDKYVDIYKISGRETRVVNYPFLALDAYVGEKNDLCLSDLMINGVMNKLKDLPSDVRKKITLDKVPNKLMTCECKDCGHCSLCEKILKNNIPKEYHNIFS